MYFGTHRLTPDVIPHAIGAALDAGFRRFDTAASYNIEAAVGDAIRTRLLPHDLADDGLLTNAENRTMRVHRSEIHVQTKLAPKAMSSKEKARAAALVSLDALFPTSCQEHWRYLDTLLLHWPARAGKPPSDPCHAVARHEAFAALIELQSCGLVQRTGVSNFTVSHLSNLLEPLSRSERPLVNQIEFHPLLYQTQLPLIEFCRKAGIEVQAYSPLGCGGLLDLSDVVDLAASVSERVYGSDGPRVTSAQLLLKWCLQHDVEPVVKSADPIRIKDNFGATSDWRLSAEEMALLDGLETSRGTKRYCWDPSIVS